MTNDKLSWTDERIALLKKMWKEGKSAAEIAKSLGKGATRNAVIGKAHRMGLSGRPSPIKKAPPAKKDGAKKTIAPVKTVSAPSAKTSKDLKSVKESPKKQAVTPTGKQAALKDPALAKEAEQLKKIEKEMPQIGGGVALIDLTERMCKWPIGDPREPDFSFCGRGIRQGTPYCHEHASMAYQSSSRKQAPVANDEKVEEEVVADDELETV